MNPFPPPNGSMPPFPPFANMPFPPPPGFPNMPFPPPGFRPPNAPPGFPNLPPWNTSGIPMQNTIVKPPVVNPLQHSTHQITTVYVGKIAAGIEDEFVRKLLEQCGRIANWRRMSDPVSGKLKGFGFCDFESPQGAITALNCLNGLTLGDQSLLIKVDEKTQKLLDEYVLKREQAKKHMPVNNNDNTPKTLDEIFGDYVRVKSVISQLIEVRERGGNYRIISVDADLNRFKVADTTVSSEPVEKPREKPKQKQEDEKPEERDKAELEREARRKEREERDYLQREEEWEIREKNKMRDRARDNERLAYERDRARRDLLEYDDNERKKRTREYIRRKRERERELQEDEADRAREIQEEEFKRREEQRMLEEMEREREKEQQRQKELELEREKARLQSMMDATMESSPSPAWSPGAEDNSELHRSQSGEFTVSSPSGKTGIGKFQVQLGSSSADKKKQLAPIVPGFDEEPEDDGSQAKGKRKLEILESALHTDKKTRAAKVELAKSLIEKIPTEKEQLFAYEMDWDTIQQHNIMEVKMRPWISKKIVEYLGEEEKSLIDFMLSKISAKMPPPEILGYIQPVLDEEADSFMVKLWRMLIFEMLSATAAVPK